MPIGIQQHRRTSGIEPGPLFRGKDQGSRSQIVGQLCLCASADHQGCHTWPAKQVSQSDLSSGNLVSFPDFHQNIDDLIELLFVMNRRFTPVVKMTGTFRALLAAPIFAGQEPAGQWAPNQYAQALIKRDWNQLVLRVSCLQRIIDLLADETDVTMAFGNAQSFHQMPSRVVRGPNVPNLT